MPILEIIEDSPEEKEKMAILRAEVEAEIAKQLLLT